MQPWQLCRVLRKGVVIIFTWKRWNLIPCIDSMLPSKELLTFLRLPLRGVSLERVPRLWKRESFCSQAFVLRDGVRCGPCLNASWSFGF